MDTKNQEILYARIEEGSIFFADVPAQYLDAYGAGGFKEARFLNEVSDEDLSDEEQVELSWEENENEILITRNVVKSAYKMKIKEDGYKKELAEGDYKIIKCMEASLTGEALPYDIEELREERNEVRRKINDLEAEIKKIEEQ